MSLIAKLQLEWYDKQLGYWGQRLTYNGDSKGLDDIIFKFTSENHRFANKKPQKKTLDAIKVLFLNLYFIHYISGGKSCLKILSGHENTRQDSSLQGKTYGVGHSTLHDVIYGLEENGFINHKKGIPGHSTKVKLKSGVIELFSGVLDIKCIVPEIVPVRCKDKDGNVCSPAAWTYNNTKKKDLEKYFNLLFDSDITIADEAIFAPEKLGFRLFNDRSCTEDGRLYGQLHQRIPKELRKSIKIDGQPTVEVDICSTHPMLIYAKEGRDITQRDKQGRLVARVTDGDFYKLPNFTSDKEREIAKSLFVIMLNAKRRDNSTNEQFADVIVKAVTNNSYKDCEHIEGEANKVNDKVADIKATLKDSEFNYIMGYAPPSFEEYASSSFPYISSYEEYEQLLESFGEKLQVEYQEEYKDDFKYVEEASKEAPDLFSLKGIVLRILDYRRDLDHWFGSEAWKDLNNKESRILMNVIAHFTDKSIPILTIHDSVRIAEVHRDELIEVYTKAIEQVLDMHFENKDLLLDVDDSACMLSIEEQKSQLIDFRQIVKDKKLL